MPIKLTDRQISLAAFQRWMQTVIVHPGNNEEAFACAAAQREIAMPAALELVLPSQTLSPMQRIGIYRRMYFLRLRDVLEADFSAVVDFIGRDAFNKLVEDYLQAHPSQSFTLNRFGDRLPEFIGASRIHRRAFISQLARLELAISQVFDAEETAELTADEIAKVAQADWQFARLRPITALQLHAFQYPVNDYLQAVRDNSPRPATRQQPGWVVVYRKKYSVWRLALTRPAYHLLKALIDGERLGDAITTTVRLSRQRDDDWQQKFFYWFRNWISEGFFQAIEF